MQRLKSVFDDLINEFTTLGYSKQEMMSEEEKHHNDWCLPNLYCFKDFQDAVNKRLIKASACIKYMPEPSTETQHEDVSSVSVGMISRYRKSSRYSSSSKSSIASSACRKAEALLA